ncbi:MAG: PmoA family protein [Bryobacteraceae bacterium]
MTQRDVLTTNRRRWIERLLITLGAWNSAAPLRAVDFDKPVPGSENLTAQQSSGLLMFRWNNRVLGAYRAHACQKYPYFYPLIGPASGRSLLAESGLPYPHHRGLWLGCQPLNEGDYWGDTSLDSGHIRSTELRLGKVTPHSATFTNRNEWVRKDAPSPAEDARTFTIHMEGGRLWWMDADMVFTAREDITIKSAKHSFFALRVIAELTPLYGGVLMNSEGAAGAEQTYGKPARWCGYHGKTAQGMVEGLAIMDHPENPWAPCPWFTRDYGHLSPSPFAFLKQPWTLAKGKSIRMRYRVALHAGTPKEADLDRLYRSWIG